MNERHAQYCPSPEWAEVLHTEILPRLVNGPGLDLGRRMVEVGPGPGASTEWLRHRVERIDVVEIEAEAADRLRARFPDSNVEVHTGDGAELPFEDSTFDSAGSFTMLHHVPTDRQQNQLLAELLRVLRPGGVLIGSDSLHSNQLHEFHVDDVYNPIEPAALLTRLRTLGFGEVSVTIGRSVMFWAIKPTED